MHMATKLFHPALDSFLSHTWAMSYPWLTQYNLQENIHQNILKRSNDQNI